MDEESGHQHRVTTVLSHDNKLLASYDSDFEGDDDDDSDRRSIFALSSSASFVAELDDGDEPPPPPPPGGVPAFFGPAAFADIEESVSSDLPRHELSVESNGALQEKSMVSVILIHEVIVRF